MLIYLDTFFELFKFFLMLRFGLGVVLREKRIFIWISTTAVSIIYATVSNGLDRFQFILYLIWILSVTIILFHEKVLRTVLLTSGAIFLIGMLDSFSLIMIDALVQILNFTWDKQIQNILVSVVTIVCFVISYVTILKKESGLLSEIGYLRLLQIYLVGFFNTLLLALIWDKFIYRNSSFENEHKVYGIFLLVVISAYYQLISIIKLAVSNRSLHERDRMNQNLMRLQENQYVYLKNTEQETKKFRHDVKNHMIILANLCKEKKLDEMEDYMAQMNGKLENILSAYSVNHIIVDIIINQFACQCKNKGISFQVKGYLPSGCKISYYDLSTIFTNILQNAYEAVIGCDRKEIQLTIRYDEVYLYIQEENTYHGEIRIKNGMLQSIKKDAENHGFGMENMRDSLQNYHGEWNYKNLIREDGERSFLLQVVLEQQGNRNS